MNARRRASLGALVLGLNLAACTIGSPEYRTFNAAPGRGAVQTSGLVCDSKTVAPDLASLQSCGGDKGHCYDRTKVPGVGTLPLKKLLKPYVVVSSRAPYRGSLR